MLRIPYAEKLAASIKRLHLRNEDSVYKWHFTRKFRPALYKSHLSELEINCAFCENLVRSSCHKHCMKCRVGTYIYCSPILPGMTYYDNSRSEGHSRESVPWYYKSTCQNFKRLRYRSYFRNFIIRMSSFTIDNFEVLEGLACGLSSGEKPCRICACVDYDIYKACSAHKGFDKTTPCDRIATLMSTRYCS